MCKLEQVNTLSAPTLFQRCSNKKWITMQGVNIYPELVSWRANGQGQCPIIIRFDQSRKHIGSDNIGHKVPAAFWDNEKKRVKPNYPSADLLNSIIENRIIRHINFILKRQAFNLQLNKELISQYLKSNTSFDSFYEYAEKVIEEKKLKDGAPIQG